MPTFLLSNRNNKKKQLVFFQSRICILELSDIDFVAVIGGGIGRIFLLTFRLVLYFTPNICLEFHVIYHGLF